MQRHSVPVDDEQLYHAVKEAAARQGRPVEDVITEALDAWLRSRLQFDSGARQRRQDALIRSDELRARQPVQESVDESLAEDPRRPNVIAVDASIALKLVLNEVDSLAARHRWQEWTDMSELLIAPTLFRAETLSVVRQRVHRGLLSPADGNVAFSVLDGLTVEMREPPNLYRVARQFAQRFNRPTIYDCCYVALAAITDCELWTTDHRLINAVGGALPWLRSL